MGKGLRCLPNCLPYPKGCPDPPPSRDASSPALDAIWWAHECGRGPQLGEHREDLATLPPGGLVTAFHTPPCHEEEHIGEQVAQLFLGGLLWAQMGGVGCGLGSERDQADPTLPVFGTPCPTLVGTRGGRAFGQQTAWLRGPRRMV